MRWGECWSGISKDATLAAWRRDKRRRESFRLHHPRATRSCGGVTYLGRPVKGRATNGIPECVLFRFLELERKIMAGTGASLQFVGKWRETADALNAALFGKGKRRRRAVARLWKMKVKLVRGGRGWLQG